MKYEIEPYYNNMINNIIFCRNLKHVTSNNYNLYYILHIMYNRGVSTPKTASPPGYATVSTVS